MKDSDYLTKIENREGTIIYTYDGNGNRI
ncbi:hypothetical protein E4T79_10555 [Streptococcus sp. LYSM12]|nr:hypothetical protein E4T79_10555 [Streptococcus sp. LYSM12]